MIVSEIKSNNQVTASFQEPRLGINEPTRSQHHWANTIDFAFVQIVITPGNPCACFLFPTKPVSQLLIAELALPHFQDGYHLPLDKSVSTYLGNCCSNKTHIYSNLFHLLTIGLYSYGYRPVDNQSFLLYFSVMIRWEPPLNPCVGYGPFTMLDTDFIDTVLKRDSPKVTKEAIP
jgi:hypothetical protein